MTVTAVASVHDLSSLLVGDLTLEVAPPGDRKTIEVIVERDASLVLKAPPGVSAERATQFVIAKRQWIYRKLAEKDALTGPPIVKQFVEGEGFAYLGRSYRLTLTEGDGTRRVRLERGRFLLPAVEADRGAAVMRRWYTDVGGPWLQRRIRPWAARLGEDAVVVEVRDLGYRWGSARPRDGLKRINIHWATLQLPRASSTTSSSANSPTSKRPTTTKTSDPPSAALCPAMNSMKPLSPPSARTSGSAPSPDPLGCRYPSSCRTGEAGKPDRGDSSAFPRHAKDVPRDAGSCRV